MFHVHGHGHVPVRVDRSCTRPVLHMHMHMHMHMHSSRAARLSQIVAVVTLLEPRIAHEHVLVWLLLCSSISSINVMACRGWASLLTQVGTVHVHVHVHVSRASAWACAWLRLPPHSGWHRLCGL